MGPAGRRQRGTEGRPRVLAVLLVAFLGLAWVGAASAQLKPGAAEIKSSTGQVEVKRKAETQWIAAVIGMRLVERDEIRAHAGASAVLDLPDGSTLFLAENSRIVVTKLEVDPQNNARQALFHLVVGKVRAAVAEAAITLVRARQSNFAITTPTAVAAVRGTLYEVLYNADRSVMTVAVLPTQPGGGRGLVTCVSLLAPSTGAVLIQEGYVSYLTGAEGCRPPVDFASLSPDERAAIGTLNNPIPPGPTFSTPVSVPTVNIFGAPPSVQFSTSTITAPTVGGPSTIGANIGQPQPPPPTPATTQ